MALGGSLNSELRLSINLTCPLQVIHGPLSKKNTVTSQPSASLVTFLEGSMG